jgi:hypothetical protein
MSGIDITRKLRDSGCSAKIVFLTVHEDADYLKAAQGRRGLGLRCEIALESGSVLRY